MNGPPPVLEAPVPGSVARVLLVADTHVGFDLPIRPRVKRRRRGHDFLANFRSALRPALRGDVDLVVHGGDLLYRSEVPPSLVETAMRPLMEVADRGIPVYIVPGNHERSRIPLHLWATHTNIFIFDRPRSFCCQIGQHTLALSGFPFARDVRKCFVSHLEETGYRQADTDAALLCLHQAVEGARVGPADFTFSHGSDVIQGRDIPAGFAAVLSGHIHRAQMLTRDLSGASLAAPVIYPGSVERTSWAERHEDKKYVVLGIDLDGTDGGSLTDMEFLPLPARPMVDVLLDPAESRGEALVGDLRGQLSSLDPDSVVRVHYQGRWSTDVTASLSAANLRTIAPSTMNISLART